MNEDMYSTYGEANKCVTFVRQTASDDTAKITSWGCDSTSTVYIIIAEATAAAGVSSVIASESSGVPSKSATTASVGGSSASVSSAAPSQASQSGTSSSPPSGLSMGAKVGLGVGVPLGCLVLVGCAFLVFRAGQRSKKVTPVDAMKPMAETSKPELAGTVVAGKSGAQVREGDAKNSVSSGLTERAELDGSYDVAELDGQNHVSRD